MLMFSYQSQQSPTHDPPLPEREVRVRLWRRGRCGLVVSTWKCDNGQIILSLLGNPFFTYLCFKAMRGIYIELFVTSHLKSESSCGIEKNALPNPVSMMVSRQLPNAMILGFHTAQSHHTVLSLRQQEKKAGVCEQQIWKGRWNFLDES